MRLRSILRKRNKGKGRGRGKDHHRYKNSYFTALGFPSLVDAKNAETLNLLKQKAKAQAGATY
jgi:RNA-directed DNA polymerase